MTNPPRRDMFPSVVSIADSLNAEPGETPVASNSMLATLKFYAMIAVQPLIAVAFLTVLGQRWIHMYEGMSYGTQPSAEALCVGRRQMLGEWQCFPYLLV